jgi:hypothetical protein
MGSLVAKAVFVPPAHGPSRSQHPTNEKEITFIKGKNGAIIPISICHHPNAQFVILYTHGNAENIQSVRAWCEVISNEFQATVVTFDYAGYGFSPDGRKPSEKNVFGDATCVFQHITKCFPQHRVLLFGRSLGTAPAIKMAADNNECIGLVLESPFLTCIKTILHTKFTLWCDMFRNEKNIRSVDIPTLIIHGKNDRVVPFYHGESLFKMCNKPWGKLWLEHAGHNNIDTRYRHHLFTSLHHFINDVNVQAKRINIPFKYRLAQQELRHR